MAQRREEMRGWLLEVPMVALNFTGFVGVARKRVVAWVTVHAILG